MKFFLITNSPPIAKFATDRGADRIMVDLEKLGKAERQGHLDAVMSDHSIKDVAAIREFATNAEILVRTNALNPDSKAEIDGAISAGADILMLPMFRTAAEVAEYSALVANRVPIMLLAETVAAESNLDACTDVEGVCEVHIGLNDLSLEMGKRFMFELVVDGTVDRMAQILRRKNMPFGIGGVARVGEGLLQAEHILKEHARLGSSAAILSRTFHRNLPTVELMEKNMDFQREIDLLRKAFASALALGPDDYAENRQQVTQAVNAIRANLPDRSFSNP